MEREKEKIQLPTKTAHDVTGNRCETRFVQASVLPNWRVCP